MPNNFEFVNSNDKYQTSSLTKFLFNKHGFKAFIADEILPNDVANNRCLVLQELLEMIQVCLLQKV